MGPQIITQDVTPQDESITALESRGILTLETKFQSLHLVCYLVTTYQNAGRQAII